ncbi:hypothetical protein [Streptomyces sp. NPDC053427]|uniref:hypothetical protein n=1 Tax=Streptomyces sp. NPDC053427 TaxID=3365701 RepID=UPI0037D34C2E
MSVNPSWTSYLDDSKVWSLTDSSFELWHAFGDDGRALCNRSIRARSHRENDTFFRTLRDADRWPLSNLHDRCRAKAETKVAAHPEAQKRAAEQAAYEAERAEAKQQEQCDIAAHLFADVHPAASRLVDGLQENALIPAREGGQKFTPSDVWGQIGAEPGAYYGRDDAETNDAMPEALLSAWQHINRLAAAGELDTDRWDDLLTGARDALAPAYEQAAPVLGKAPGSWQVLFHTDKPLTGEQWADFPVHAVMPTVRLRAGHDWHVIDRRLDGAGLSRYGFTDAVSAGHALSRARKHWETHGPHAAWYRFIAEEAPAIEILSEMHGLTPEQEREAFACAQRATAGQGPEKRFSILQAIAGVTA